MPDLKAYVDFVFFFEITKFKYNNFKNMNKILIISLLFFTIATNAQLVTYNRPCTADNSICVSPSLKYAVEVRQNNGEWSSSFTYFSQGHAPSSDGTKDLTKSNSWTSFSFSGSVEVKVKLLSGTVSSWIVRPKSKNIIATKVVGENAIVFTVSQPGQFVVEFNGSHKQAMMVFANPMETNIPKASSAKLHYFGPGVHDIGLLYGDPIRGTTGGNRTINEGDTIYIAGGAYLLGTISCTIMDINYPRTRNVTIMGRGVLSGELYTRLSHPNFDTKAHLYSLIRLGDNSKIDGITITAPAGYSITTNDNCTITNTKVMAWYWSTDAYATGFNCITENSFSKVNDDHSKSESSKQTIRNNVYYLQSNGSMLVTGYNTGQGTIDFGAKVTDCDVLHADESYDQPVIKSVYGGGQTLSNYTFENFRIEGNCTRLFGLAVRNNAWAPQDKLYGRLANMTFKNVTLEGRSLYPGYIWGATTTDYVSNVVFDNVSMGGRIVTNAKDAYISIGPYVHNLYFKVDGNTVTHDKGIYLSPEKVAIVMPSADCPVYEKSPNENFGAYRSSSVASYWMCERYLIRNISNDRSEAFVRFENVPAPSTYSNAYLGIFGSQTVSGGSFGTIKYTLVNDDSWSEATSTWNSTRSISVSPISVNKTYGLGLNMIDITDMAKTQSDGKISIKLSEYSNGAYSQFDSRESLQPFLYFTKSDISALKNVELNNNIQIIPNPARDFFMLKTQNPYDTAKVEIYDVNGCLSALQNIALADKVNISNLQNGVYFVKVTTSTGETFTPLKLIKSDY